MLQTKIRLLELQHFSSTQVGPKTPPTERLRFYTMISAASTLPLEPSPFLPTQWALAIPPRVLARYKTTPVAVSIRPMVTERSSTMSQATTTRPQEPVHLEPTAPAAIIQPWGFKRSLTIRPTGTQRMAPR